MIEVSRKHRVLIEGDDVKRLVLTHLFSKGVCIPADATMLIEPRNISVVFVWFEDERIETADEQ